MTLFKQKITWIGFVGVFVVLIVFGAAMMGSVLGMKPQHLPVALVVADQPAQTAKGKAVAVGEMIKQMLLANEQMPFTFTVIETEAAAREALDEGKYYGALVLPADLSANVSSLMSAQPVQASVSMISNDGLNTQAATVVKQGLGQAMRMVNAELARSMLSQIGSQTEQLSIAVAQALLSPIQVQEEAVHAVGANNASGNAPGLLTQIMWMGSLIAAVILFLARGNARKAGANSWASILAQLGTGVIMIGAASGFLIWMASSWYGMELAHASETWLFLWLAGSMYFLIQSALLNWIGFPAMAIMVLLMFFSMPILNAAPEFLTQTTRDWIYSWTPLRFVADGLREVMYFSGLKAAASNAAIVWSIGGAFLLLLLASGFKKGKASVEASRASAVPAPIN
ncbi:YhgE/Pip-like protein [Paenibacillus endophyticus]|uniref:YhgE/Pip-like protein n=1 Tax=Paenibacillus endophyticus TaxID=1294268 RepID=A0A7W5C9W1_9BACL|nr:ABC transporter permease [Paenibacillus endophyticus]MBB3152824.1 YhgE/Pip-like protein [Paenibacillus endophyticus]